MHCPGPPLAQGKDLSVLVSVIEKTGECASLRCWLVKGCLSIDHIGYYIGVIPIDNKSDFIICILGRRLSKRMGSKALCLPLFSLPGERVCERAYFPVTSDIPTRNNLQLSCVGVSFFLAVCQLVHLLSCSSLLSWVIFVDHRTLSVNVSTVDFRLGVRVGGCQLRSDIFSSALAYLCLSSVFVPAHAEIWGGLCVIWINFWTRSIFIRVFFIICILGRRLSKQICLWKNH